ncbi:hypothetical protein BC827DRAFT_505536 [Russula dissimulans]|nr:hypothetical protein BC827DRAFT_505536 [Russula dissimulans]
MDDDHEVDWGNDEDDSMQSRVYSGSVELTGGVETDDVEDAVSLGGDEEEEFAAYGARSNEQRTSSADKIQNSSKKYARRRSPSSGVAPRKDTSRVRPTHETPSPQLEVCPPTPKLTHALPPKPVLSSSIRAPPSTTAASPMSLPRKERRSNGSTTKKGDEASLSDRETRSTRTAARDGRHRDSRADESSWSRPSPDAVDSQPLQRDRTKSISDRDSRPPLRREDDFYRPTYNQAYYSSDEEGREPDSLRAPSRRDVRYRFDDRDRHHDYASGDRIDRDRPVARSARLSPEGESMDRLRTGYRESNDPDFRRSHPRDRDISPVRDDSSRRVLRREDYPVYDSFDKGSRDYDDPSRRSSGTAERSRYPESYTGRTNSVVLRDPHTQNQGPGRSSTLRRNSPSPRLRSRSPPPNRRDDRRHSPPRYQEYPSDSSRLPPYRGRADTPPPRLRGPDRLDRRDTPLDVPQRRPRGISDAPDPDYAPKRRKMDDENGNLLPVRRGPIGADTYIPLDAPTISTSPRSAGALDDLSRQRRREPLPSQSHRYKEASELAARPPLSGPNITMPQTQHSAQPPHRHYPPSSRDHDLFPPRHPDTDRSPLDRSRTSGHDPVHVYVDKISRDDHMRAADPPYPPRGRYEEPVRLQNMANRTSLHHDTISRGPIPPTPHSRSRESMNTVPTSPMASSPMLVENFHGRSRDRSPRPHHEPRQMGSQPLSASSPTMQPPPDLQFIEAHRHYERRIDRDREGDTPILLRNVSNSVPSRSRSTGRYDGPEGDQRPLRSPERNAAPPVPELQRLHPSSVPNPRRERQVPPIVKTIEVPPRVSGDLPKYSPPLERVSRSGPSDAEFPPPAPPAPTPSREWIPRQPEFMSNLPPPSTRLPGIL